MTNNKSEFSKIPSSWIEKWQPYTSDKLPLRWEDDEQLYPPIPRKAEITEKNEQTLERALYPIRNS